MIIPGALKMATLQDLLGRRDPVILEIGCNDGSDTRVMLEHFPGARIYCFEPDPRARARFEAHQARLVPMAVGAVDGTIDFYPSQGLPAPLPFNEAAAVAARHPQGWDLSGSIRKPKHHLAHYPWCQFGDPVPVPVTRLDTWAAKVKLTAVDFIWADVQGAEVDLIAGAPATLAHTRFFYTEYNDKEMYEGQQSLAQILALLPAFEIVQQFPEDVLLRNSEPVMLGLAIPTYQREDMLLESFAGVYEDPRIEAITIVDDASDEALLRRLIPRVNGQAKIQMWVNSHNEGCYRNKRNAIDMSPCEWNVLLDSNNSITTRYLEALGGPAFDRDVLYIPSWAQPVFNYTAYEGLVVTRANVAEYFDKPQFSTALNTGNFFVHRETYLRVFDLSTEPLAADSLYFCFCWLASGRSIQVVPRLYYAHRIHDGNYVEQAARTKDFFSHLERQFRELR